VFSVRSNREPEARVPEFAVDEAGTLPINKRTPFIVSKGNRALTAERLPLKAVHSRLHSQSGEHGDAVLRNLKIAISLRPEQKKSSRVRAYYRDHTAGHQRQSAPNRTGGTSA
jgi:hypothetical protein